MTIPDKSSTYGFGRRFAADVERETDIARKKFLHAPNHLDRDLPDKTLWVSVLLEEVGKMARCCNKLSLIPPSQTDLRLPWDEEGQHRLRTIASLVRRMAEKWCNLPDEQRGKWTAFKGVSQ
ncbi:hypothetical protein LCGC14_0637440 [marine sediment metagenome]|uniref:Uncharacterized protein n=1 Tax=marine sediment metagenome TaxID=412755 RepID=A0A0F9U8H9_9ZZZZ